jgi:lipid-A-disaccharide synthase
VRLAFDRRPDVIVCVDFSVFNHRFARKIRWELKVRRASHGNWKPKIVKYVSPQVWASRPGRAKAMAREFDLLLTLFPFEKAWYGERVPSLRVEFVGHPIVDRYANAERETRNAESPAAENRSSVLLLPGSRVGELKRHLPPMLGAVEKIRSGKPGVRFQMVLPNDSLANLTRSFSLPDDLEIRIGGLQDALRESTIAIASTGTVTMECAYFGVPTVALYKTSWSTYQIGRRIIQVKFLAMPNLLANERVFPELIQDEASAENLSREAIDLLDDPARREAIQAKLAKIIESLGEPGASQRAAKAILSLG